jgi:hypothetical protein
MILSDRISQSYWTFCRRSPNGFQTDRPLLRINSPTLPTGSFANCNGAG